MKGIELLFADTMPDASDIATLLSAAKLGDARAEAELFSLLYADLRELAHSRLRRSRPCTLLETTALVHEAYLRLSRAKYVQVSDRWHFLAYAASAMRSIVVDLIRRSPAAGRESVSDVHAIADPASLAGNEILRVDEALKELGEVNRRLVKVVEMRYFAGMKESEIAEALSLTERTVRRDWEKARILLATALR
jgi:RNA polymerase sigma factor (TIGR02999 family)